ncbi:MAG: class I SAM-dependent rRNA methyltransferase [Ilumatobacteraceae bacterium]
MPSIWLRSNRERSLKRHHPWIFSGGVAKVDGDPQPGDTVAVKAADGTELGWAAYSPMSQIRARMWTFDTAEVVDEALIVGRIQAAVNRRTPLLQSSNTDSARLVFSEADDLPGLTVDRYGDTVVCQLTTVGVERWRDTIAAALAELPGVRTVYERSDGESRTREGLEPRSGVLHGEAPSPALVANERGWKFAVDVATGHKTGFYLDQRNTRRALETMAADRRMLNVFSYTGAFSVIAADCGATSITNIDSSGASLEMARHNGVLNGVDIGERIDGDAFTVLREQRDRARQYDLIVLDPPKLAKTEAQLDKASRAYKDLNLLAVKLLAPGGMLLTFSCSGAMSMDLFQKVVAGAALDAKRTVRIIDRLHQPGDHPIPLAFPEAEYLKGLVLQAD